MFLKLGCHIPDQTLIENPSPYPERLAFFLKRILITKDFEVSFFKEGSSLQELPPSCSKKKRGDINW